MKLIINADDLGLSAESNEGIRRAWELGFFTQTTFVANSEFSEAGAQIAADLGIVDIVGLHLNIGEQRPLSEALAALPKYVGADGMLDFNSVFMERDTYGLSPLVTFVEEHATDAFRREVEALRDEVSCQVERFRALGFSCRHVDSHRNALVDLPVWLAARPVLEEAGFRTCRPTFDSFATDDLYNRMYRTWLAAERADAGLATVGHSSSIPKFVMRRDQMGADETVEAYVHPQWVDGQLLDGFTGGNLLADDIAAVGDVERTTFFEL